MLIDSHRLTKEDRRLWAEYEEADLVHAVSVRVAIEAIESFLQSHSDPYVGVSWGKDSVVTAYLVRSVDPSVPLIHLRPTNHNPDCDLVRDAYFASFPGQPYVEVEVDYSSVDRLRWTTQRIDEETDRIWYTAIKSIDERGTRGRILGVRAAESRVRAYRVFRWGENTANASAPIGRWSTQSVFSYLAQNGLPVHPAYAMLGGGRWPRERLRVAEIGDTRGTGGGRSEWEQEYYGDVLSRIISK